MGEKLMVNPWLRMWIRPHETIRAIIQYNASYMLPLLYWLYGLPLLLQVAQNTLLGDLILTPIIVVGSAISAIFVGWIGINLGSILFYWTGKLIGGLGSYREIRAAVAWSSVVSLVSLGVWVMQLVVFGGRLFTLLFLQTTFVGVEFAFIFLASLIQTTATIWGVVILLKGLGEAQRFSDWKALLNVLLPIIIMFICFKLLAWLFFLVH